MHTILLLHWPLDQNCDQPHSSTVSCTDTETAGVEAGVFQAVQLVIVVMLGVVAIAEHEVKVLRESGRPWARSFGLGLVHKVVATCPIQRGWHQGAGVWPLLNLMMMQAHATLEARLVQGCPADLLLFPLLETGVWFLMEMEVLILEQGDLLPMYKWVIADCVIGQPSSSLCKWKLCERQ